MMCTGLRSTVNSWVHPEQGLLSQGFGTFFFGGISFGIGVSGWVSSPTLPPVNLRPEICHETHSHRSRDVLTRVCVTEVVHLSIP